MKWAEMSTEQKNHLIHEKVMGGQAHCPNAYPRITFNGYQILEWKCQQCGQTGRGGAVHDRKNGGYIIEHTMPDVPHYTTSMDAAWQVAEQFDEIVIERHLPGKYHCQLSRQGSTYHAIEATPQEAICVAALTVCGVEIE